MNKILKSFFLLGILISCESSYEKKVGALDIPQKKEQSSKNTSSKKKGKKKKTATVISLPYQQINSLFEFTNVPVSWKEAGKVKANYAVKHDLKIEAGKGILVYQENKTSKGALNSQLKHSNIEIEFDFMPAKSSHLDLLFMGRYNLVLSDSWKAESLNYKSCGALGKGNKGKAPKINVSKAPGLWQHMKVVFLAPKFDTEGNKITDATFKEVHYNGVLIHQNVGIKSPTNSAIYNTETPNKAPLVFKGTHGAFAFKNIKYKTFDKTNLKVTNLTYKYYKGNFPKLSDLEKAEIVDSGKIDGFYTDKIYDNRNLFGLEFNGEITIPHSGTYVFHLKSVGLSKIFIDGKEVIFNNTQHPYSIVDKYQKVQLTKGIKDFKLQCSKGKKGHHKLFVLVEGPELRYGSLNSYPSANLGKPKNPITLKATNEVVIQRGFVLHHGVQKTNTLSVGHPEKINYSVDFSTLSLIQFWNGEFADLTDMWHARGKKQLLTPLVTPIQSSGDYSIKILKDKKTTSWEQAEVVPVTFEGYRLNNTKEPIFLYKQGQMVIEDHISVNKKTKVLERELSILNLSKDAFFRIATGKSIEEIAENTFNIDGNYLIKVESKNKPYLREIDQKMELLTSVESTIKYAVIW